MPEGRNAAAVKFQTFYLLRELRVERMFDESEQVLHFPEASSFGMRKRGTGKAGRAVTVDI